MAKKKDSKAFWNFVGNLEGDKVVWMIVLLLILLSIVAIFSSTPLLAIQQHTTRTAIMKEQLLISLGGLFFIILCYNIKSQRFFQAVSKLGFWISMGLLLFLTLHIKAGPVRALYINDAWRSISFFGFQVHVFEVVKVAMVMYLAWAVDAFHNKKLKLPFFLQSKWCLRHEKYLLKIFYIYLPIMLVCIGIMPGSLSSTLFIGGIMFLTILVGGISIRELFIPVLAAIGLLIMLVAIDKASPKVLFPHLDSALARLENNREIQMKTIRTAPRNSIEFQRAVDKMKQPESAKIAVYEGRGILIGKGPGGSTQRYVVPVMFEDYMFSFIIEEYGLLGAIIVIFLYISLLARGSMIVRNCDKLFDKTAVAGLVLLITAQAMMHMFINVGIGPLTGQTLPMVSHGNSSFIMFSIAFGIILSISRNAKRRMDKEIAAAQAAAERSDPVPDPDDLSLIENIDEL